MWRCITPPDEQLLRGEAPQRPLPVVFLFPGQGAQYVQMGRQLYEQEAVFREQIDHGAALLQRTSGLDLRRVLYPQASEQEEAEGQLGQTQWAQPALFLIEYALARQLMAWGIEPEAMLGHSLGEYVAACLAGVFTLEEALSLVAVRGQLMQRMPAGGMLDEELALAAVNSGEHCVVSGPWARLEALEAWLGERKISSRRLRVRQDFLREAELKKALFLIAVTTGQTERENTRRNTGDRLCHTFLCRDRERSVRRCVTVSLFSW